MAISCVVLTKNEDKNIEPCLASLSFCDEIVVIDDDSTDKTLEIVKKFGAKIYSKTLRGDFAAQRNYGISKAKHEWVLFVDADERISQDLAREIKKRTEGASYKNGFLIKREDILWGRPLRYGETGNSYFIRLGKKNFGRWIGKVHEVWQIEGGVGTIKEPILHFPHQSINNFLKEINNYTTIRAQELFESKTKVKFLDPIIYPKVKFLRNFFLKLGFLDGIRGMIFALIMSFHSFLVRAKLWQLWNES